MASRNNKRALKIIRHLRSDGSKQAEKIDMLCHDMVSAHREFSTNLVTLKYAVSFYERLLGCADMEALLEMAVQNIHQTIEQTDAAVVLLTDNDFEVHIPETGSVEHVEKQQFRLWFTREIVKTVSQMNRVCLLDQLLRMGLQGPPAILKTISLAAIPLGRDIGLLLVYRPAECPFQVGDLSRLAAVSGGLREAITGLRTAQTSSAGNPLQI